MKKIITFCAILTVILAVTAVAPAELLDAMQAGGERLADLQNNDGGWDWPLDDGNPANVSPTNTIAPTTMGLIQAYLATNDASMLTAINNASTAFLNKQQGNATSKGTFSAADGYIAVALDQILGVNTHANHVKTQFYDKLAAGTYVRLGQQINTTDYVNLIRSGRTGSQANMAAWDVGVGLFAANAIGADTQAWLDGTEAEINELSGDQFGGYAYYDVIGLAGGLLGLASVGENFDPTAGEHAAADSTAALADILASYQIEGGGFAWTKNYVIPNDGDETVQETAYAMLALSLFDSAAFAANIAGAADYLVSVQLATGGWETYTASGENNEITAEALWALSVVPEPATIALLSIGGLALLRKKKNA